MNQNLVITVSLNFCALTVILSEQSVERKSNLRSEPDSETKVMNFNSDETNDGSESKDYSKQNFLDIS